MCVYVYAGMFCAHMCVSVCMCVYMYVLCVHMCAYAVMCVYVHVWLCVLRGKRSQPLSGN